MKFYSLASANSVWRGYEYYNSGKVNDIKNINAEEYSGKVLGSNGNEYEVIINVNHPKKNSHCNCLHAKDNLIVCKHKVALYFEIFPEEAKKLIDEAKVAEKEYEKYQNELYDKTTAKIRKMNKSELQDALINILDEAPEWIYDRFVREYVE